LIRIFSAEDGSILQEVRRGSEKAEIYSIVFDSASKYFACSSDRGTIHIFATSISGKKTKELSKEDLEEERYDDNRKEEEAPKNQKSIWDKMTKILPIKYFKSEWSFAQFRIPDLRSICAFGPNNSIICKLLL
jgi:WD40 repeat protein